MNAHSEVKFYVFHFYQWLQRLVSLSAHIFLYCFSLWLYILNVLTQNRDSTNFFSNTVHVYRNLFWKIFKFWSRVWSVPGPLFRRPLIAKRFARDEDASCIYFQLVTVVSVEKQTLLLRLYPSCHTQVQSYCWISIYLSIYLSISLYT